MGDLANALTSVGLSDEALQIAEKGVVIQQARGDHRNVATGHGLCASILMAAGRYEEADARYEVALAAAPVRPGTRNWRERPFNIRADLQGYATNSTAPPASTSRHSSAFRRQVTSQARC